MNSLPEKKTKIICTIGPASQTPKVLREMIRSGMNVARLNFAHGDFEGHKQIIDNIRMAADDVGERIAIMADLPGPKLRIGEIENNLIRLERGQSFIIQTESILGNQQRVSMDFKRLTEVLKPGDKIFLSDGFIQLEVEKVEGNEVHTTVQVGGELRSYKGVNLPGIDLGICAFTERDRECMEFAKLHQVTAISQSFVQDVSDIQAIKIAAAEMDYSPFIIAKIERANAVKNIDQILAEVDGIMVARGDLGVEIPISEIALAQKQIIRKANVAGKPVITATHMLESMIDHNRPTRAEATDVANAILDGTDCVMLSGETAMGEYPVESVAVMSRIACEVEPHLHAHETVDLLGEAKRQGEISPEDLISLSIEFSVKTLDPVVVVTPTISGATARRVCRFRLPVWIISVSPKESTCQELQFSYGVYPIYEYQRPDSWAVYARDVIKKFGIEGELALLTKGTSSAHKMGTNEMEIIDLTSPSARKVIW